MGFSIIVSPAKKMNVVEGPPFPTTEPILIERTKRLMHAVQSLSYEQAKDLWKCSDKLATLNYGRFRDMDLARDLTAASLAYEGIQYQHMAPQVMDEQSLAYLDAHLRILSGFYGVLRPCDGVVPYRLEMQARLDVDGSRDLYGFWGTSLAETLRAEADTIVNVASVEYAKAVTPHAEALGMRVVTCLFCQRDKGRLVQRSTEAKAARGTFVRWCAENGVSNIEDMARFCERGYALDEGRSDKDFFVFVR